MFKKKDIKIEVNIYEKVLLALREISGNYRYYFDERYNVYTVEVFDKTNKYWEHKKLYDRIAPQIFTKENESQLRENLLNVRYENVMCFISKNCKRKIKYI